MSLAAPSFDREPPRHEAPRWILAAAIVLAVHVLLASFWLTRQPPQPKGTDVNAVLLDLPPPEPAPAPAPPQPQQTEAAPPPAPDVTPPEPVPPPPVPQPEPLPPPVVQDVAPPIPAPPEAVPPLPALPKSGAVIEAPKPDLAELAQEQAAKANAVEAREARHREETKKREEQKKREAAERAKILAEQARKEQQRREAQAKAAVSAQASAAKSAAASAAMGDWRSEVVARISGATRALPGGGSGVATVAFTVDRSGRIGGVHVVRGSGQPNLDQEAAETVRRAGSVPPPPGGTAVPLTMPIRFKS